MSAGLRERSNRLATTGKDAVASGAYFYPAQGVSFLLTHAALRKPLYKVAIPATLLSLGVLGAVFGLLYLPQVAALAIFNGPVAFVNAALLCLSESSFLINAIARAFLLEDALLEVFDATLIERGQQRLVAAGREIKGGSGKSSIAKLGKLVTKPLAKFSPRALLEYLIFLPLNAIPVVGTAAFVLVQGYKAGPRLHARYFDLKKFDEGSKNDFVRTHRGAYTGFGVGATVLSMIPFASIPMQFTNTAGAALWAANLEKGVTASTQAEIAQTSTESTSGTTTGASVNGDDSNGQTELRDRKEL